MSALSRSQIDKYDKEWLARMQYFKYERCLWPLSKTPQSSSESSFASLHSSYRQIHRFIPQKAKQWPESKAKASLDLFLLDLSL